MVGTFLQNLSLHLSLPAAAAQLGAVTRDIDDAAAEESDEQGEDNADSRVVSMGLFIEI